MNIAFCIGNGPSSKAVDLTKLKNAGPIYGCNSLIQTFDLDNTIVVDRALLIDLIAQGYNKRTNIYTRKRWAPLVEAENLHFLDEPIKNPVNKWDNEIHWGSGTHALNLAAKNQTQIIVMIGYDLYNSSVDPTCWIYQINKCLELYPETQFVQIQNKDWACPAAWENDNFSVDTFKNLLKLIKGQ
jgi:hypothetical protein